MGIPFCLNKPSKIFKAQKIRFEFTAPNSKQCMIGEFLLTDSKPHEDWLQLLKQSSSPNPFEALLKDSKNCKHISKLMRKSVPVKWRWKAWKSFINLSVIPFSEYAAIPLDKELMHAVILKDIDRTFPNLLYFDKEYFGFIGQFSLLRVLSKFATCYKNVGYCQGMNFVAGFLLLVSGGEEVETYSMLEAVIFQFNLADFFTEGMAQLKKTLAEFDGIFAKNLKNLYWHFKQQDLGYDLWVLKWFLTLFTAVLPVNVAVHVWDILMADGVSVLPNIAICLLKYFEANLTQMDGAEILMLFAGMKDLKLDSSKVLSPLIKKRRKNSKPDGKIFPFLHPRTCSFYAENREEVHSEPKSPFAVMSQCEITEDPSELPVSRVSLKQHGRVSFKNSLIFDESVDSTRIDSKPDDGFDACVILQDLITEDID